MNTNTDTQAQPQAVLSSAELGKLYADRDHAAQGEHYMRHIDAMTREGLHAKSDIAGELAHRDIEIERLRADVAAERERRSSMPLTREQIDAVMTEHYPLDSLLRENVDAFEACVRDIERLLGIGPNAMLTAPDTAQR